MMKKPFEGLNVLDFTWAGVGPFTTNFLGYFGATIIRVESATRPDPVRCEHDYVKDENPGMDHSPKFAHTHPVKKLDITLNLKHPKAIDIFKTLVAWSDVIVENFTTGAIERMGFGYDELKKIKPNIILHRTNGFGHTGPMANHPGFGQTVTALAGFHSITGWPDRQSVPVSKFYTDSIAPIFGALTLIAAIDYLRRTGKGQCIDHSQIEAGINYLSPLVLDYVVNGRDIVLNGNKCRYASPYGAYRCKGDDRWVAIGVETDEEWANFCKLIGNPEWTNDSTFSTISGRIENSEELDKLVEAWTISFTAEQAMAMLQSAGVSAGVVATAEDAEADPQLNYYDFFPELDHPYLGKRKLYHPPGFKLSNATVELGRPPLLGEHNYHVYTKILGISEKDFVQLKEEGVFN